MSELGRGVLAEVRSAVAAPRNSSGSTARTLELKRRLVAGARLHAAVAGVGITPAIVADVCAQVGVSTSLFRRLFPSDAEFLDEINDLLVEECAARLAASVSRFRPAGGSPFSDAASMLAHAHPLTRSGMHIRAHRRLRSLEIVEPGGRVAASERRYVAVLVDTIGELLSRLEREFQWPPILATRVVLDSYERSFELWIIGGGGEDDFSSSPYVARTLPRLLQEVSRPRGEAVTPLGS